VEVHDTERMVRFQTTYIGSLPFRYPENNTTWVGGIVQQVSPSFFVLIDFDLSRQAKGENLRMRFDEVRDSRKTYSVDPLGDVDLWVEKGCASAYGAQPVVHADPMVFCPDATVH
jgi:hypothetical protein